MDATEAIKWYRKAAMQGHAEAQYNLSMVLLGSGSVSKDDTDEAPLISPQLVSIWMSPIWMSESISKDDADEAVKWLRKAAMQGHAEAQYRLNWMYALGAGVPEDDAEAVKWLRKAAMQGHAEALGQLGRRWRYANGEGVSEDDAEAYRKAAIQGHAAFQYWLGWMYANGRGVSEDDAEAVKWYRKAAMQGHIGAQADLGWMYANGRGVSEDDAEAVKWLRKAASTNAKFWLGWMYVTGTSVHEDDAEVAKWLHKAATPGYDAQFWLGSIYVTERVGAIEQVKKHLYDAEMVKRLSDFRVRDKVVKSLIEATIPEDYARDAVKWFRKVAMQGHAHAQTKLGWIYDKGKGVSEDDAEAVRWYRKAAIQGHSHAQYNLGWMYANGEGVPKDDAEGARWYRKAAMTGYADAQFRLGRMYANGKGVPKDNVLAYMWLNLAGAQGLEGAKEDYARIAKEMTTEQIADAQRLSRTCLAHIEAPKLATQQPEDILPCDSPDGLKPFFEDGSTSPWDLPRRVQ